MIKLKEILLEGELDSDVRDYVTKNYKKLIQPGIQKMLEGVEAETKNGGAQLSEVSKLILKIAKYQMEVWDN